MGLLKEQKQLKQQLNFLHRYFITIQLAGIIAVCVGSFRVGISVEELCLRGVIVFCTLWAIEAIIIKIWAVSVGITPGVKRR